jgi:outer membrane protein OmpA-like peptidoglycan-associated protein
VHVNSGRDSFAAQGIAGVAYSLDSIAPGLALTAEYRFYDVPNEQKYAAQYFAPGVTAGPKLRVGNDINHAALIGLRYAFNAAPLPPPPPVPVTAAPPVAPATRSYLVFFDWDRADLTDRARNIIADAAANSKRVQYTKIAVNGYTDLSGTAQYNQGLSVRRAQAVAGELTKDGVPSSAISIQGFGETHPLVPTAAGVREPQNRRVEIIIQ